MNINEKIINLERKAKLSTLWIFVLLNIIFRDIHQLFKPGFLEEMMNGTVNGTQMTDVLLLQAGIALEVIIAMVILSRFLSYRLNRWTNIIVGAFSIVSVVVNLVAPDLDDLFFAAVEIGTLVFIIWYAWTWSEKAHLEVLSGPKETAIGQEGFNELSHS